MELEDRIAELTKNTHDAIRRAEAAETAAQTQRDLNMQLLARANTPVVQEEDPYEDVDPKVKKMLGGELTKLQQSFAARLQAQQNDFESRLESQELQHQAAVMGLDAESAKEASVIIRNLKKRGLPVEKEEIMDMMIGKAVREGKYVPPAVGTNPRRTAPLSANRAPNFAAPETQNQKPLPPNFDDLSPEDQLKILEKRGAGNSRI